MGDESRKADAQIEREARARAQAQAVTAAAVPGTIANLHRVLKDVAGEADPDPAAVSAAFRAFEAAVNTRNTRTGEQQSLLEDPEVRAVLALEEVPAEEGKAAELIATVMAKAKTAGRPVARRASEICDKRPAPLLSLDGDGAVLSAGEVCIVAGEGGVGKSALVYGMAVDVASAPAPKVASPSLTSAGPLVWHGGASSVLLVTLEDRAGVVRDLLAQYAEISDKKTALERIHVLELRGHPLYGPPADENGRAGFYSQRPARLPGWADVERAVAGIEPRPRLLVIDPALAAYVGESNSVAPVREFLIDVATIGGEGSGVLLVAHSNKDARKRRTDPFDPGLVGGSGAFVDGVRGVLSLQYRPKVSGGRDLACLKANWGPSRLVAGLDAIRVSQGEDGKIVQVASEKRAQIVGFTMAEDGVRWHLPKGSTGGDGEVDRTGGDGGQQTVGAAALDPLAT